LTLGDIGGEWYIHDGIDFWAGDFNITWFINSNKILFANIILVVNMGNYKGLPHTKSGNAIMTDGLFLKIKFLVTILMIQVSVQIYLINPFLT